MEAVTLSDRPEQTTGIVVGGRRIPQLAVDVMIGITLATVGFFEMSWRISVPAGATGLELVLAVLPMVLLMASGLSLSLRRIFPLGVMVFTASVLVSHAAIDDTGTAWMATLGAALSAGLQARPRRHVAIALGAAAVFAGIIWTIDLLAGVADPIQRSPFTVGLLAAVWWVGDTLRNRSAEAAELKARAVRLELERQLEAQRAAAAERARIARELHDVIAHSLSVVVIQAAAARRILNDNPQKATASLEAVEQTGRSAMLEMRRLLGVVRRDEHDPGVPREPQPSMTAIESLIEDTRRAGLDVSLRREGSIVPLPPGVDVSAYRIVQEALTNALRYSHGARAEVIVRYSPDELTLHIENEPPLSPATATVAGARTEPGGGNGGIGGHGLAGMRERVALLHGALDAGPRPDGGFVVSARLPLGDERTA